MANVTITQLPTANALTGTEAIPLVQNGVTVQASAAQLGAFSIYNGTVTSVNATVPAFLTVSGGPITTSGTLAISYSGTALPIANGGTGSTSTTFVNLATNVTGTLPVANGGTGLTSFTANGIVYASSTSALATGTALSFDGANMFVSGGNLWQYAPAPTSLSGVTTLTAAQLGTDVINTTGTTYTVTLPLATAIDTRYPAAGTSVGLDFHIVNTASGTITVAVNTGITSVGTLTVATGVSAAFRLRRTATATYILYRIS